MEAAVARDGMRVSASHLPIFTEYGSCIAATF